MKNINKVLKKNLEEFKDYMFDKHALGAEKGHTEAGFKINSDIDFLVFIGVLEDYEKFVNKHHQNLISAFKEMVEELPNVEVETIQGNKRTKVELKAKFTKDLLSSLTEETKHGAGSNCDIDMCPECEKSDNNFSN